jgi:predicted  nucleic acid-binding Zn-ribbon protein
MPENDETPTQGAPAGNQERTFTQAELDAVVRDRLKREREKYADYAELQRKASAYDEAQEAAKSDLQKAVERAEKAEQALAAVKAEQERAALVAKLAAEKGVSAEMLSRMAGDVAENAAWLAEQEAAKPKYPSVKDKGEVASIKTDAQNDFVRSLFKGDR